MRSFNLAVESSEPCHSLYFGTPRADDGHNLEDTEEGQVGVPKNGESQKHGNFAFRRH